MNELQELRQEIKRATASSSIENLKLIQKLYNSVVQEFKDSDLEMQAQLVALKAEIDHFPTLLKDLKTGPEGQKGDLGERGERGEDGKDGEAGRDGVDGKDGQDGKDGVDGKDGSDADLTGEEIIERINNNEDSLINADKVEGFDKKVIDLSPRFVVSTFQNLVDTPDSYAGKKGKILAVKDTEDGLEFVSKGDGSVYDIKTVTSDYTVIDSDYTILVNATGGNITITLPSASSLQGSEFNIKKIDSSVNLVTVDGNGSETIDGSTTAIIETQYESITIQSDGSNWYII